MKPRPERPASPKKDSPMTSESLTEPANRWAETARADKRYRISAEAKERRFETRWVEWAATLRAAEQP